MCVNKSMWNDKDYGSACNAMASWLRFFFFAALEEGINMVKSKMLHTHLEERGQSAEQAKRNSARIHPHNIKTVSCHFPASPSNLESAPLLPPPPRRLGTAHSPTPWLARDRPWRIPTVQATSALSKSYS